MLRRIFDWIDRHAALFIVVGLVGLTFLGARMLSDEHRTCTVQSRGLKAQRHLTNVMADISKLLEPPPTLKQAPVPPYARAPLANLRIELPAYTALENKQPAHRSC